MRVPLRHNARVPQIIVDERKVGRLKFSRGNRGFLLMLAKEQNPPKSEEFLQFWNRRAEKLLTVFFAKAYSSRRIKKSGSKSSV